MRLYFFASVCPVKIFNICIIHYIWDEKTFLLYHGLGFCLVEAGRVEDSTFMENTMQVHRRWAQLGGSHIKWKVRRRRTSTSVKSLSITKFLFEALAMFSSWTKLRTSSRFLHGLSHWNRFFEPLTSSMFLYTLMLLCIKEKQWRITSLPYRYHHQDARQSPRQQGKRASIRFHP